MEITCYKIKGNGPPKTFSLREQATMIYCPIVLFLVIAFIDDAFLVLSSPEQLSKFHIPLNRESLELRFKEGMQQEPIFRKVWRQLVVTNQCLSAEQFRKYLRELSIEAGFTTPVLPYAIRRGAANTIEGKGILIPNILKMLTYMYYRYCNRCTA